MAGRIHHILFLSALIFCTIQATPKTPKYKKYQALGFGIDTEAATALFYPYFRNSTCKALFNETKFMETKQIPPEYPLLCLHISAECFDEKGNVHFGSYTGSKPEEISLSTLGCYVGNPDVSKDVAGRLKIMKTAVDTAYKNSDTSEDTLKIFMAPEFYWRGSTGSYPMESIFGNSTHGFNTLNAIGKGLADIAYDPKYKDWLFVFGTVVAQDEEPVVMRAITPNPQQDEYRFYNFAPIYKGGARPKTKGESGMAFLAPKVYISSLDFLTSQRNPSRASVYDNQDWEKYEAWLNSQGYTMIYDNWFVIDDILMTIEICLDHMSKVARNEYQNSLRYPSEESISIPVGGNGTLSYLSSIPALAQISLVTSAGMDVKPESLIFRPHGSIFLQDGQGDYPTQNQRCSKVTIHKSDGMPFYRNCTEVKSKDFVVGNGTIDTFGLFPVLYSTSDGVWVNNPPHITIFEPVGIPWN